MPVVDAGRGNLQEIASKKVGEVSVASSTSSSVSASVSTGMGDLTRTVHGLKLLSLIRLYSFAAPMSFIDAVLYIVL